MTSWTAAWLASLSFSISLSWLRLMSIELVMPSNHPILCCPFSSCPQSFPASGSFLVSWLFASGGQSIGASASPFHIWSFTGTQSCWLGYVLSIYCVSSYSAELSSCDTELEATESEIYYPALFRKSLLTSVLISCLMRKTSGVRGRVLKWSMDIGDRYKPRLRQRR